MGKVLNIRLNVRFTTVSLTSSNIRTLRGMINKHYYHDGRIVGGKNIFYYEINLAEKTF